MKTTKQRMRMEIKEISETGTFTGLLSVYNVVDLGKDIVEPGAFTKTIQEHGAEVPLLWQHKTDVPIGKLTLRDTPSALEVDGKLLMELPEAQKAYLLIKSRIVKGLSIGFDTVKESMDGAVRRLKELRLWEGSIVTFPMCEQALIASVKGREKKDDFNTELADIQLQDGAYQMMCALNCALSMLPWAQGMTKEQKVAAAETTIQQFSDAFMAFLPNYLDWLGSEYGMEMMKAPVAESKGFESRVDAIARMFKEGRITAEQIRGLKYGAEISGANKKTIKTAHEHMSAASDLLLALIEDEAVDEDTSKSKAAGDKPEPAPDHSAIEALLTEAKGAFQWNHSNRN